MASLNSSETVQPDSNLAYVYEIKGMRDEAVASYLKSRTLAGDTEERIAALKTAYAVSGWKGYLQRRVDEMQEHAKLKRYTSPFSIALLYPQMGEKNEALHQGRRTPRPSSLRAPVFTSRPAH